MLARALFNLGAIANEFGWVEHDDVILFTAAQHVAHVSKRIGLCELNLYIIQRCVLLGGHQWVLIEVDAGDFRGLTELGRLNRESAGVAADIQHGSTATELGEFQTVLTLVAEESRFVAGAKVNAKLGTMFGDRDLGW